MLATTQPTTRTDTPQFQVSPIPLDGHVPDGPIERKWEKHRFEMKLVNPANRRRYRVIVVGSGLAGGAAAASSIEVANSQCDHAVAQRRRSSASSPNSRRW